MDSLVDGAIDDHLVIVLFSGALVELMTSAMPRTDGDDDVDTLVGH